MLWIVAYCVILGTIRGNFGDESIYMLLALLVFTAGIIAFVKANHLEGKYGLAGWPKDKTIVAIIVSAMTFGIGHIVHLFSGQASFETVMQIIFAISWGFILTMVCLRGGSIIRQD